MIVNQLENGFWQEKIENKKSCSSKKQTREKSRKYKVRVINRFDYVPKVTIFYFLFSNFSIFFMYGGEEIKTNFNTKPKQDTKVPNDLIAHRGGGKVKKL